MKLIYEYLTQISANPFAEDIQSALIPLDQRIMLVHNTYGGRPEKDHVKLNIREAIWEPLDPNSITTLSLATSYLISNFGERVSNELCAHSVSDEKYGAFNGRAFLFKVSFLSFGSSHSSYKPNEEREKTERALQSMRTLGYQILETKKHGQKHYSLLNCPENIRLLGEYFTEIGLCGHLYCESYDHQIREIHGAIEFEKYIPYVKESDNEYWDELNKPLGKNPTADQMVRLESNLKKFKETTLSFFSLGEDQCGMMADLLISYTYELESLLGYQGDIWKMEEKKHASIRAKNRANLNQVEAEKEDAFKIIEDPTDIFNHYFQPLHEYVKSIGFHLRDIFLFDYGLVRLMLQLPMFDEPKSPLYDGFDNDRFQPIIYATSDKLIEIEKKIQEKYPKFKLTQNLKTRFDKGHVVLDSIYGEMYLQ